MFGPLHTPKLNRILAHVLHELRLCGKLRAGDTGVNEAKHKGFQSAYARTNRGRSEHALQLVMVEQVADALSWTVADNEQTSRTTLSLRMGKRRQVWRLLKRQVPLQLHLTVQTKRVRRPLWSLLPQSVMTMRPGSVGTVPLLAWVSSRRSVSWRDWPSAWSSEATTS